MKGDDLHYYPKTHEELMEFLYGVLTREERREFMTILGEAMLERF